MPASVVQTSAATTASNSSNPILVSQSVTDLTSSSNRMDTQQQQQHTTSINTTNIGGSGGVGLRMSSASKLVSLPPPHPTLLGSSGGGGVVTGDLTTTTTTTSSSILPLSMGVNKTQLHFDDPVEQSLASLEQPIIGAGNSIKQELSNVQGNNHLNHHLTNPSQHMDLIAEMSMIPKPEPGMNALHGLHNNGFVGMDITSNGIIDGIPPNGNGLLMSQASGMSGMSFDLSNMGRNDNVMSGGNVAAAAAAAAAAVAAMHSGTFPPIPNQQKKEEKLLITPKPIEQMMPSPPDKKMTPPDLKLNNTNFIQAFKERQNEQNLKNASSWSSLASAGSPQNTPTSNKSKPAMDSFQQFRNKAIEKLDRQKLLEQQELKRSQKEAAEKEMKRKIEQTKQQKQHTELDNGRKSVHEQATPNRVDDIKASPQGCGSPGTPTAQPDRSAAKRAELRRMEQERRRREAMAGQIDMNMQSDLMAAFEESL